MHTKKKICIIVSSPITIKAFLKEHVVALSHFYDLTIIVNSNKNEFKDSEYRNINFINLAIHRNLNLIKDCYALFRLIIIFKKEKFILIHSVTPKAGLLSMFAGFLSRVSVRIHIFTGQFWITKKNITRTLYKFADKLIVFFSTNILADSESQMKFLIKEGIALAGKISVLANGSISGVDTERFIPNNDTKKIIRKELNIKDTDIVFCFIGRLKYDKGILDLCTAFKNKFTDRGNVHLLIIGPDEENMIYEINKLNIKKEQLHLIPYAEQPEKYMASADALCLPSYREGFGSVIIEAASCGLPSIGSRIYGITDAILENETGLLYKAGDINALGLLMEELYLNKDLGCAMGKAARDRTKLLFSSDRVTTAWLDYYSNLI